MHTYQYKLLIRIANFNSSGISISIPLELKSPYKSKACTIYAQTLAGFRYNLPIMAKKNKKQNTSNQIAQNKRARFDYSIESTYEAGLVLEGWEVKSLRAGKIQIKESYVIIRNNEAWLFGALITPLVSASSHTLQDPLRLRKLLMHRREIDRLMGLIDQQGYTLLPLNLYWKMGKVKATIGLAKGKKQYDKRAAEKDRDWNRDKQRIMKMTR